MARDERLGTLSGLGRAVLQVGPQISDGVWWPAVIAATPWSMPLSATIDGEQVCAPLFDDRQWAALRGKTVVLQPCGHRGFIRVSKLGTRHFVHERGCDCHHGESAEHLRVKSLVASAVAACGWMAATEVPGPGFVADVLAQRAGARVVFEVQRSRQVLHEYERRQATYAAQGLRCVWLAASVPAGHQAGSHLPLFLLSDWLGHPTVVVAGRRIALPRLVSALLTGACRWRESVHSMRVDVETLRLVCPLCGKVRQVCLTRWVQGRCPCGLAVQWQARPEVDGESQACCGYWGAAVAVERRTESHVTRQQVPLGHWCVSS